MAEDTGAEVVRRSAAEGLSHRIGRKLWKRMSGPKPYLLDYQYEDWLAELRTIVRAQFRRASMVHLHSGVMSKWMCSCDIVTSFRALLLRHSICHAHG